MPKAASQWSGVPSIKGSSEPMRMVLLTFGLVGVVFSWALEATYCTPYLLSLGLAKSTISLVFIAGPLSGLLMQPVVGAITDRSTSKYGRRRPFIVGGAIIVGICLILLGWTKEAVALFVTDDKRLKSMAIITAVLNIYVIDFAINAVQACLRSLIVDSLPISQQQSGSSWAMRVGGFGGLASYGIGSLNLVKFLPMLPGDTQFKKMTVISVAMLWISTGITCYAVQERVLLFSPDHTTSIWGTLPSIWHRTFNLPPRVRAICWVQFWAWIGWFPFLFYGSTWVGETYYRYEHKADPTKEDTLGNIGRLGSVALVLFSAISFASSVLLPYVIRPTVEKLKHEDRFTPRPPPSLPRGVQRILLALGKLPKPSLMTAWQWAHLSFAFIMMWSPLVRSLSAATLLIALCGVPSAVGGWAPFAEIGIEINRLSTGNPSYTALGNESAMINSGGFRAVQPSVDEEEDDDVELSSLHSIRPRSTSFLHLSHPDADNEEVAPTSELAGVYLGVLNVYTTLPQFIGTFIGWVVFSIFEPDRTGLKDDDPDHHRWLDTKGINGISVCFFIGAICAVGASEATRRLKKIS